MAKQEQKPVHKGASMCPECKTEFIGISCPDCGNSRGNIRLAQDGIDQTLHKETSLFGDTRNLLSSADAEMSLLQSRAAAAQIDEFNNNMRDAYVVKSEIRKKELELEKLKKDAQLRDLKTTLEGNISGVSNQNKPGQNQSQDNQQNMGFSFAAMDPKTVFMSQLMKMDHDKRAEFLTQLSEADPQAMNILGNILEPVRVGNQNPMMGNMMGYPQGSPYWMSPWMQQMQMAGMAQQPAGEKDNAGSTLTMAISLLSTLQDMMAKNTPKQDETLKDFLRELKDEQKALRQELAQRAGKSSTDDYIRPLIDELNNLKQVVASSQQRPTVADTLNEVTTLVESLEKAGFVNRFGSQGETVDDKIKMKKLDHEIDKDQRSLEIEAQKIDAEKTRLNLGQAMMASLMSRTFRKNEEKESIGKVNKVDSKNYGGGSNQKPPEVVERYTTDGGSISEVKSPFSKSQVI